MAKNSGLSCAAEKQEVVVSYLPLSHIAAQMMDMWLPMKIGAFTYFAQPDALKVRLEGSPGLVAGFPSPWIQGVPSLSSSYIPFGHNGNSQPHSFSFYLYPKSRQPHMVVWVVH